MSHRLNALASLAALLACNAAPAATVTAIQTWTGSTGYVWGRPFVAPSNVIYGVLSLGANGDAGSIYSLTPPASGATAWKLATISSFTTAAASNGTSPVGGLTMDPGADTSGDLYGATATGGSSGTCVYTYAGCGTIYSLTPPKSGTTWTRTVIYRFTGSPDGAYPVGSLVADSSGALYGETQAGGCTPTVLYPTGCGTVFKLTKPASGTLWTETVLYRFMGGTTDGVYPNGGLTIDASGNLYGATWFGGTETCNAFPSVSFYATNPDGGCGVLFELAKTATSYKRSLLHVFKDGADGSYPLGGLAFDATTGRLFGATAQGGNTTYACTQYGQSGCGLNYVLRLSPRAKNTMLTLNGANGGFPTPLLGDAAGKYYGEATFNTVADTTCKTFYCGTTYEIAVVSGKWTGTLQHAFSGTSGLGGPEYGLAADSKGTLYGVALSGSTSTLFSVTGTSFTPARHTPTP